MHIQTAPPFQFPRPFDSVDASPTSTSALSWDDVRRMIRETSSTIEAYGERRKDVRQRYAELFDTLSGKPVARFPAIRDHPRWKELMEDGAERETRDKSESVEQKSNLLLGPAFIASESTVRNDYSQRFVDTATGELPSNAVRNPSKATRFSEYPKLQRLIERKASLLDATSIPATYLKADLSHSLKGPLTSAGEGGVSGTKQTPFHLSDLLPIKYDVVIIDPPLEAYEWESTPSGGHEAERTWSWDALAALPIPQIVAKESFIFLWVGSGASDGLERGREVLMRWGYRRCEDIVWIRTNDDADNDTGEEKEKTQVPTSSAFTQAKQHCLMGIRGTIRRSTDTNFVHCNIDTDVILWPGEASQHVRDRQGRSNAIDVRSKPPEMMDLIENFCLGTRRLELFGRNRNLRRGWLTIGLDVGPAEAGWLEAEKGHNACAATTDDPRTPQRSPIAYEKTMYDSAFGVDKVGCSLAERSNLVPFSVEIDNLRPRSPRPPGEQRSGAPSTARLGGTRTQQALSRTSFGPAQSGYSSSSQHGTGFEPSYAGSALAHDHSFSLQQSAPVHLAAAAAAPSLGGAGLSGLGAGGKAVVSVQSGSELLSGAQANVLLGQESAGHRQGSTMQSIPGPWPTGSSGPSGLGRRGRKM